MRSVKGSIALLTLTNPKNRSKLNKERLVTLMGITLATHNGSKACRDHNIRNEKVVEKEKHIRPDGEHEIWKDESVASAYHRIFDEAVFKYNSKQKRNDRKIKNYYSKVCKDAKKHPVYEMIVGVYGLNDDKTAKEILKEFDANWEKRNPNLIKIGSYWHNDEEGEQHIHVDYIPVAHNYKNGLELQSSLVKALGEQNYFKRDKFTAQILWEKSENAYLESLCNDRNIKIEHPHIENAQHLDTEKYKLQQQIIEYKKENEKLKEEKKEIENECNHLVASATKKLSSLEKQIDNYNDQVNSKFKNKNIMMHLFKAKDLKTNENGNILFPKKTLMEIFDVFKIMLGMKKEIENTKKSVYSELERLKQLKPRSERSATDLSTQKHRDEPEL